MLFTDTMGDVPCLRTNHNTTMKERQQFQRWESVEESTTSANLVENNSSHMQLLVVQPNGSYPLTITTSRNRNRREGRRIRLERMVGRIVLLSVWLGGTLIASENAVFAYVPPSSGITRHRRMIRRNGAVFTRTVLSSSKIAAERTKQTNATSNDSDTNNHRNNVQRQTLHKIENHFSHGENFFHGDSESDGMNNLESLLVEDDSENIKVQQFDDASIKVNNIQSLKDFLGTSKLEIQERPRRQPELASKQEKTLETSESDLRMSNARSTVFRRIRPFKRIRRIFGRSSSEQSDPTSFVENDNIQMSNDTDIGVDRGTNMIEAYPGNETDISLNNKKPSLRKLWRKRNARTLEEGIRRERKNKLSVLMNKALVNARPSEERSYVERFLMGLLNGLAEEVEDLDIEVDTVAKTPLWRKEVDEIRINFSRLGFRPIQIGGTNPIVEVFDTENDSGLSFTTNAGAGGDASATNSSAVEQRQVGGANSTVAELSFVECADEGFDRIDEDGSGTLDSEELAQALNSISGVTKNKDSIEELASDLVRLYDDNGDGVVDREEYQQMVEDMAKLREMKDDEDEGEKKNPFSSIRKNIQSVSEGISSKAGEVVSAARDKYFSGKDEEDEEQTEMGSIVLSKVNLDLRRLVFGALPGVKKITPGGPLILEPFTATVTASFSPDDFSAFLLDAALRRLVARALRVRVRSYRDLVEGALFVGRRWKMTCKTAPVVEVLELSKVEFDSKGKLIITGKARIRADPDAPVVTSTFKVRTKIGTRKNGQVIKLKEPELAFVFECPKTLERGLAAACETFGLPPPKRPEPYYSFFPIYSPFKVDDDTGGFDMGEDNCIRSIYVQNGKLRFEMSVVLRPGRFLGNHYLAFTVPQRTFIITMDRVWNGVREARANKQKADRAKKTREGTSNRDGRRSVRDRIGGNLGGRNRDNGVGIRKQNIGPSIPFLPDH
mmetsp:Transcript_102585/g.208907  ORF Transcript_102585/g.208907 Transcript_102585/m.208907 type:complete len:953 (+) Transcript_102585:13-2871(+)